MYLRCRDNSPWAGPKRADYSRLSCGVGDTQLGPHARISAGIVARALFIELHCGDSTNGRDFLPIQSNRDEAPTSQSRVSLIEPGMSSSLEVSDGKCHA